MTRRYLHLSLLIINDLIIAGLGATLAFMLRFEGDIPATYLSFIPRLGLLFAFVRLAVFYGFNFYRSLWRYASIRELVTITGAVITGSVILFVGEAVTGLYSVPRSVYLIDMLLVLFGTGFVRFLIRYQRQPSAKQQNSGGKRVLIYGAGEAGVQLLAEFRRQPELQVRVVGFVDDDVAKVGGDIHGVPVLGDGDALSRLTAEHDIEEIIIAMPAVSKQTVGSIVRHCQQTKARLMILPPLQDILHGQIRLQDIRQVDIEDLLGREPIQTDLSGISSFLEGKRVLVTGAGGSIGSELCRQVSRFNPDRLIMLGHGENSLFDTLQELKVSYPDLSVATVIADIRHQEKIERVFARHEPQVVFHAAAHKHVPFMEEHPDEAVMNNVFGTKNVARAAAAVGAECFVMVSTDKAVNPGNVMGATKRLAELIVQALNVESSTRFVAVRFGNVLGSRGSVVPLFKQQIDRGGPVTVTHPEMTRYFMTIPEAVQLILQAGAMGRGGELYLLDMGEPVKIVDLARSLIRLLGFEPDRDIDIVFTGVRPGEKLFEELVNAGERVQQTEHEKIVQLGCETAPLYGELAASLTRLRRHLVADDLAGLKSELYAIVGAVPVAEKPVAEEKGADDQQRAAAREVVETAVHQAAAGRR